MRVTAARPQTLPRVVGFIFFAVACFGTIAELMDGGIVDWRLISERIVIGIFFAMLMIANDYRRLSWEDRLPAIHAIGLGGFHLVLVAWVLYTAPGSDPRAWFVLLSVGFIATPGTYLLVMGVRQFRGASLPSTDGGPRRA